jgi:hypothetical protein
LTQRVDEVVIDHRRDAERNSPAGGAPPPPTLCARMPIDSLPSVWMMPDDRDVLADAAFARATDVDVQRLWLMPPPIVPLTTMPPSPPPPPIDSASMPCALLRVTIVPEFATYTCRRAPPLPPAGR